MTDPRLLRVEAKAVPMFPWGWLWWLVKLPILLIGCVMQGLFWIFDPMSRFPNKEHDKDAPP